MARFCGSCGAACNEQQVYCPNCSRPLQRSSQTYQTLYEPPMKWYNFIIYFQLFAAAAFSAIGGILYISGSSYGEAKDLVYEVLGGLRFLDFFYGLACLGLGIFALYVRSLLRWREENGPKMYYIYLILNGGLPLVYLIGFNIVLGDLGSYAKYILEEAGVMSTMTTSMVSSLISTVIMLVCNVIYFKKREHLFGITPVYKPSYSTPSAPAYNPAHGISANSQPRTAAPTPATGWTCECGRVHTAYVTSCICGRSKSDIQQRKAEAAEEAKAAEAAKAAAEAAKAAEEAKAAEAAKKDTLQDQVQALKSYKELLDAGILTQEEFDAKKKELLSV